jgi:hypothetical protein
MKQDIFAHLDYDKKLNLYHLNLKGIKFTMSFEELKILSDVIFILLGDTKIRQNEN